MMLFSLQAIKNKVASCLSLGVFTAGDELHWGDEIHWPTSKNWKGQAILIVVVDQFTPGYQFTPTLNFLGDS